MTELMKRYEAETGEDAIILYEKHISDEFARWVNSKYLALQAENAQLKAQLTWRPVSEKPEKEDMYFVEVKPYTGCESTIITTAYFDGERFPWHDVVKWLPIPPAPEGE